MHTPSQEPGIKAKPTWSSELEALLKQLQQETLLLALPGLFAAGALISLAPVDSGNFDRRLALSLASFALIPLVWYARRVSYRAAAWVLILGSLAVVLLAVTWAGLGWMLGLLALPAGLTTLMLGPAAGAAAGGALGALLLFLPPEVLPAVQEVRLAAGLAVWGTIGLIWLTLRPLLRAVGWAWSGYERSQALMEQMQDAQVRLKQTLEDLTGANLQLTRLNRVADGLRQAAEEARRAKEQFVANVSHELRTPLNMIIGFSEMIVESPEAYGARLPPALLADLTVILRNSKHLSGLVDDVLDLSQIETGQMALTRERVALAEIVESAAEAVRPLFESKGLYLKTDVAPDLPQVYCDRTRVREVVLNLLSNAGRFTERGGATVRAARQDGDIGDALVSVADTGPGIASADRDKLFRPFQQLDGTIRRRYGGSGLGLAISKSFVELHGGRMWLDSAPGAGTTFYFTLPIDPPAPVDAGAGVVRWLTEDWPDRVRTRPSLAPPAAVKPRFVVLESEGSLGRLLQRYMSRAEIVHAASYAEAERELSAVPSQALLVNDTPVGDWIQRLSAAPGLPYGAPAIVCSVPGLPETMTDLGVSDYLVKPIARETLLAALERWAPQARRAGGEPDEDGSLCTVLIADDEPDAVRLFWRTLAGAGPGRRYRVLTASDGRQALEILRRQRPDVVLLDLVMPDVDGYAFLAEKNADPELRGIPVLVISARDPAGQPIVSNALAVTRAGGLSLPHLLSCFEALSAILSPLSQPPSALSQPAIADPAPAAAPPG